VIVKMYLPPECVAELLEVSILSKLILDRELSISTLVLYHLRKDFNSIPSLWTTLMAGDRNIRTPRAPQRFGESELDYLKRLMGILFDLSAEIKKTDLSQEGKDILCSNYAEVCTFFQSRCDELDKDETDRKHAMELAQAQERERKLELERIERERVKELQARNVVFPAEKLAALSGSSDEPLNVSEIMNYVKES